MGQEAVQPKNPTRADRIVESIAFDGPATAPELARRLGWPLAIVRSALRNMQSDDRIQCNAQGEYEGTQQ